MIIRVARLNGTKSYFTKNSSGNPPLICTASEGTDCVLTLSAVPSESVLGSLGCGCRAYPQHIANGRQLHAFGRENPGAGDAYGEERDT